MPGQLIDHKVQFPVCCHLHAVFFLFFFSNMDSDKDGMGGGGGMDCFLSNSTEIFQLVKSNEMKGLG